ncbi:hypothetical protein CC77DRAFT_1018055 [Alternaria alternata]|uniref:Uncharacterized protein n=1 Tax=Alternaria alternata TaxID=5599 RepID=A0A177DW47_ALTAL|nr:hypothetical protein CC77DRAFT_1018055 [Alternaria alternata]OAG23232.1 hypothetical protein CC77DRAFT_1018055 [Alternaria alternata]
MGRLQARRTRSHDAFSGQNIGWSACDELGGANQPSVPGHYQRKSNLIRGRHEHGQLAANASVESGLEAGQYGFQMHFQAFVQPTNAGLTSHGNGPCVLWWGESNHSALRRVWHRRFFS